MITVKIKPRQDDLYDMYVGDEGDHFVNSDQGYDNVEDCIAIARRLWPPLHIPADLSPDQRAWLGATLLDVERVVMQVTYRNGKTKTEQLR